MSHRAPHSECPACDSTQVILARITLRQAFRLPAVTLTNVLRIDCRECGESSTVIPRHGQLMRRIRQGLCNIGRTLRGTEFAFLRAGLGYSQQQISDLFGVRNVTVSRWENGASGLNQQADLLLRAMTLDDLDGGSISDIVLARQSGRRTFEIDLLVMGRTPGPNLPSGDILQT